MAELVFEFLIEFFGELFLEIILTGYIAVMTLIVPKTAYDKKLQKRIKAVATVISIFLLIALITGIVLLFHNSAGVHKAGMITAIASGAAIALQIVCDIVATVIREKKK